MAKKLSKSTLTPQQQAEFAARDAEARERLANSRCLHFAEGTYVQIHSRKHLVVEANDNRQRLLLEDETGHLRWVTRPGARTL